MSEARHQLPSDHVPEYPAPYVHSGPDPVVYANNGILMVENEARDGGWMQYDGPISEVTR